MRDLTNTPYKQFIWFIAEVVEAITDTDQLGRVRIRVLGFHSEDTPRDKLPLALVMNGGAARLVEKQWVVGFFLDGAMAQQPFVLGTVGSAIGNSAKVNSQENPGPNEDRTKGTPKSLLQQVEDAKEKLRRAIVAGGDVVGAKEDLDKLEAKLKAAEAAEAAKQRLKKVTPTTPPAAFGNIDPRLEGTNGYLDESKLVKVSSNQKLDAPAAAAYQSMVAAAEADGIRWSITDSYRNYAQQVDVANRKGLYEDGGLAARPGTSRHGWGRALDLGGGAENFGTPQNNWLQQNAGKFGFKTIAGEPWHWQWEPPKN